MTCKTVFKINISSINEEDIYTIIDYIGVEPGITDNFLYYGLIKNDTDVEDFLMHKQLNETLSLLYDKKEILKKLKEIYSIYYIVDIKFSNIEEEIERNTCFLIDDEAKEFINYIDAFYNLNDGYFE